MTVTKVLPECWGHRGASAAFPENTLASFEAAINDGADGIESDVHVSLDGVVIMFHDPDLERTTGSKGCLIRERHWYGENGMENLRTVKQPQQCIPTFVQTIALLMKPENQHVKFNVDVKVQNDPDRLFSLMHDVISTQPDWQTKLAPRILLGLWHPRFVAFAKARLPYCRRSHIGGSLSIARKYFWDGVEVFSMAFASLTTYDGQKFRNECKAAGKKIMVWTVNEPEHMMEAVRWGIDVILTDVTKKWLELRAALQVDYDSILSQYSRWFLWTTWKFYLPPILGNRVARMYLEGAADVHVLRALMFWLHFYYWLLELEAVLVVGRNGNVWFIEANSFWVEAPKGQPGATQRNEHRIPNCTSRRATLRDGRVCNEKLPESGVFECTPLAFPLDLHADACQDLIGLQVAK
ncbi:PLC-like phosphodiesterase [Suillus americanus]|nr:PLC-like phosphodiesterase [Suillus americanus]